MSSLSNDVPQADAEQERDDRGMVAASGIRPVNASMPTVTYDRRAATP